MVTAFVPLKPRFASSPLPLDGSAVRHMGKMPMLRKMITGQSFDHPVFFISHLAVLCPLLCEVDRGLSFPSIWLLPSRLFLSAVLASTSFFTEWPYMVIKYV
jgi:hypothetical protein